MFKKKRDMFATNFKITFLSQVFSASNMTTAAYPVENSVPQYSRFGKTSPGFNTPDSVIAERANVFTPAYAHPMHYPQRMTPPQYYRQYREEENSRKEEEQLKIEDSKRNKEITPPSLQTEDMPAPK